MQPVFKIKALQQVLRQTSQNLKNCVPALFLKVKDIMKDVMANLQQTNSEKILLSWVRQCTRPYHEVNVLNFTTSWADGLALNSILHHFR